MSTLELKKEIHSLVDKIEDEERLSMLYDVVVTLNSQTGSLWETLTVDEQEELRESIEESRDPKNWIPHEQVREEYKKWLSR